MKRKTKSITVIIFRGDEFDWNFILFLSHTFKGLNHLLVIAIKFDISYIWVKIVIIFGVTSNFATCFISCREKLI